MGNVFDQMAGQPQSNQPVAQKPPVDIPQPVAPGNTDTVERASVGGIPVTMGGGMTQDKLDSIVRPPASNVFDQMAATKPQQQTHTNPTTGNEQAEPEKSDTMNWLKKVWGGGITPPEFLTRPLAFATHDIIEPYEQSMAWAGEKTGELAERVMAAYTPYTVEQAREKFPRQYGLTRAVAETAGSTLADPRNWPLLAGKFAQPILNRIMSGAFATQMGSGIKEQAEDVGKHWDDKSPYERWYALGKLGLGSAMTVAAASHATVGGGAEAKVASERGTVEGDRTTLRPTTVKTAGVEAPIPAIKQENPNVFTKMATKLGAEAGKLAEFQKEQTKPAATRQAVSALSQVATDKIAAHDALANGEAAPDPITGTQIAGEHATPDRIWDEMQNSANQTWEKARQVSASETEAWERERVAAEKSHQDGIDHYNELVSNHNADPANAGNQMQPQSFNPDDVNLRDKPKTYDELKSDVDAAKDKLTSDDTDVRQKAKDVEVPKAEKALDKWFADHDAHVSKGEYESAKQLWADSERFKEIANNLRSKLAKETLTANDIRGLEAVIDGKAIKRRGAAGIGEFKRLLGPEAYDNLQNVSKLFEPFEANSPLVQFKSWGMAAIKSILAGGLGYEYGGTVGAAASEGAGYLFHKLVNRILFDPTLGSSFVKFVELTKNAVSNGTRVSQDAVNDMKMRLKDLWQDQTGEAKVPGTGRKSMTPTFDMEENGKDEQGDPNHIMSIKHDDKVVGHLNVSQRTPDSWTINDSVIRPDMQRNGLGTAAYAEAFRRAAEKRMATVESDISTTQAAARTWRALMKKFPGAITEENGQFTADLSKMPQPSQVDVHNANGGSTFDMQGKNLNGADKYSVGSYGDRTESHPVLTEEVLRNFKQKNADVLSQPNHAVGTWNDNGNHVLDVSKLYDNRDEAITAGKAANQMSIYHLGSGELIDTGGPGSIAEAVAKVADKPSIAPKELHRVIDAFNAAKGRGAIKNADLELDPRVNSMAEFYKEAKHNPNDPRVKASYDALKKDVDEQYALAEKMGYTFTGMKGDTYADEYNGLKKDVFDNKHVKVWQGAEFPKDHPLSEVDPKTGLRYAEKMLAIHDLFGHAAHDNGFSVKGEENAWNVHRQMFSPEALPALATETRGRGAYGAKYGEFPSKATIMPEHLQVRPEEVPAQLKPVIDKFNKEHGRQSMDETKVGLDPRQNAIADAYAASKHSPNDPAVKKAYGALKKGIDEQYDLAIKQGYSFDATAHDPYEGTAVSGNEQTAYSLLRKDATENKHISAWKGGAPPTDHPLSEVDSKTGLTYNEKLRAIHDLFGHVIPNNDFTAVGEENAWNQHRQMFPDAALPALATETKGQSAYVAKNGEFADQRATILPKEFHRPAGIGDVTPASNFDASEITTRRPKAVGSDLSNKPGQHPNMDAIEQASRNNPSGTTAAGKPKMGYKEKLARTVADYTGIPFTDEDRANPDRVLSKFVNHVADNLEWLYNQVPEEIRGRTRQWYDSAHTLIENKAKAHGFSLEQGAGVTAALSPQNPWDNNLALADRMMDIYHNRQNFKYSPAMEQTAAELKKVPTQSKAFKGLLRDIAGKKLKDVKNSNPDVQAVQRALWIRLYDEAHGSTTNDQYSPTGEVVGHSPDMRSWIGLDHASKAVKILENGSVENINAVMGQGHKIRNFYNNIINPMSRAGHTTIDTHAVAAGLLTPVGPKDTEAAHNFGGTPVGIPGAPKDASTGLQGTYPLYTEAYQRTARKLGILPRELQSVTWEAIKSLMGDDKKTPELKKNVRQIWEDVQAGRLTPEDAREKIKDAAKGFLKPAWMSEEDWEKVGPDGDTSFDTGQLQTVSLGGETHGMTADVHPPVDSALKGTPRPTVPTVNPEPNQLSEYADWANANTHPEEILRITAHELSHAFLQHHFGVPTQKLKIGLGHRAVFEGQPLGEGLGASPHTGVAGGFMNPGDGWHKAIHNAKTPDETTELLQKYTTQLMAGRAMEELLGTDPDTVKRHASGDVKGVRENLIAMGVPKDSIDGLLEDSTERAKQILRDNWSTMQHMSRQAVNHYGSDLIDSGTFHKYRNGGVHGQP
jgi:hypothetical protein